MAYPTSAAGAAVSRAAQPRSKPTLKPEVIQSAMDRRPRLNANQRRAAPAVAPKPAAPAAPAKPAWQQLRDAGVAATGSAAGNRAAAANLPYAVSKPLQLEGPPMPPPDGGMGPDGRSGAKPMMPPPDTGKFDPAIAQEFINSMHGGGPGPGLYGGGTFTGEPLPMGGPGFSDGDPTGLPSYGAPSVAGAGSGSQNPLFSANLPPQIMQRLQALQAGRGGAGVAGTGQGAPGTQPPGAPAALQATIADYYRPQAALGMRPAPGGFDRSMAY